MANERILLVEDNEDNSKLVQFLLERAGYEITGAHSGQQGMDMARTEMPDMILMNLSLPEVDGWTAARDLKAHPRTNRIPTLALKAQTQPNVLSRTLESGFDGFISKPIHEHSFATTVSKCLKSSETKKVLRIC